MFKIMAYLDSTLFQLKQAIIEAWNKNCLCVKQMERGKEIFNKRIKQTVKNAIEVQCGHKKSPNVHKSCPKKISLEK